MSDERRHHPGRIGFRTPRPATFGQHKVVLSDLGHTGAGIRHRDRLALGTEGLLTFRLECDQHSVRCRLLRSRFELVDVGSARVEIYHSGLNFLAVEGCPDSVRVAIRKRVERALLRQHADAWSDPSVMKGIEESSGSYPVDLLASMTTSKRFIRCSCDRRGRWKNEHVDDPAQPENGFTLSAEEDPSDIELLRRTFAIASRDQRDLIRLFARLALEDPSDVPRSKFVP